MLQGRIYDIQRFSIHDGPGIRTTVFFKGCPLRCAWCHNPESQQASPEIVALQNRCLQCGECLEACPLSEERGASPDPPESCRLCGLCVEACPAGARRLLGRDRSVEEVMDEILADRAFYEESGGGATFGGGEPLAQAPFLCRLLDACRAEGIHTAVDTCGYAPAEDLLAVAPLADLFLYDLKLLEDQPHRRWTGASNDRILENLRRLSDAGRRLWIRIPIIPGVQDAPAFLREAAELIGVLQGVERIDLLPYHKTGSAKFARLGRPYGLEGMEPPDRPHLEGLRRIFQGTGIPVHIGG